MRFTLPQSCRIRDVPRRNNRRIHPFVPVFLLSLCPLSPVGLASPQNSQSEAHVNQATELINAGNLPAAELELRTASELAPNDASILGNLGTVLAMERKFEESTAIFRQALKIDPANVTVRRYLAANLWQLQRYPEAKQNLNIILQEKPGDPPTLLLLGMVSENMKDYTTAAKMLAAVPALTRKQPEAIAALARSYYHIGSREKARVTLAELLKPPAIEQAVLLGGLVADEMQDYETAKKLLVSIQATFPDQAAVGYSLALVEYHAKQFDDSRQTLLHLISSGLKSSKIYNLLGWCYQQQRQPANAVDALEQAISLDPAQESNYLDLGKILLANGLLPAALELAKRTAQAFPNSSPALLFKGEAELKVGQFTDAVDSYSAAFHLDSPDPDANLGLAEAQFAAGRAKDATASFEAGMGRFPKDARFPLQYALMLLREADTGNATAGPHAEELLKSALALDHSLAEAHYQLGEIALKKGQAGEALTHLQTAAKLDPRNAGTHFALASLYRRLGRKAEASTELTLYQTLKETGSQATPATQPDDQPRN
jgi:tetratricopeptide (TPR) repeat protein